MLLVEQNAEMALQLADRVYVIDHGTVVFEGTPARAARRREHHRDLPGRGWRGTKKLKERGRANPRSAC